MSQRKNEDTEGREAYEEESVGQLAPNPELEEALREATESVEALQNERKAAAPEGGAGDAAALREELAATQDRLVRLHADMDNLRKRTLKEREEAHRYGHQNLVKDLLATVDNLDRAIEHAQSNDGGDLESMLQGVELVRRELLAALKKHGVERIDAEGEPFDPNLHEAMAQTEDPQAAPNSVVQVFQTGYRLRDRLLRPARVLVAKGPAPESPKEGEGEDRGDAGD